jgi:hypothetical protein
LRVPPPFSKSQPVAGTRWPRPTRAAGAAATRGPLLWRKRLSATDAQRKAGQTSPTGDLRLTQAGFRVRGALIRPQTYFRRQVFGSASWKPLPGRVAKEHAQIDFDITILGNGPRRHRLTVQHKPSGEARQRNYTTGIRWGQVLPQGSNLKGRVLRLYGPPPGSKLPFFIDVT